jgi:hypothetical protein
VDVAAHANLLCVARVPRPNPCALYRRCLLASSQAGANSRFICVALKASASYCSGTTVRLMLHPLCEPPHAGMVSKRLHGIIASCKVCIANRDMYVSVARATQGDRPAWVASLDLPHSWHLPAALCPEFSSFCVIPRLYGPSTRTPRHLLAPEGAEWWVLERPGTQGRAWSLCESASCSPATSNFGLLPYALTRYQQPEGQR